MFIGFVKPFIPMLTSMPMTKQSEVLVDVERWLTRWFEEKASRMEFEENEVELTLMFRVSDGELLMIPCVIGEDANGQEYISRDIMAEGLSVTRLAENIPAFTLLPTLMARDNTMAGRLKLQRQFIDMLRKAADVPGVRLTDDATYEDIDQQLLPPANVPVDALGASEDDEDEPWFSSHPIITEGGEHLYEIMPQDEWDQMSLIEQDELLADLDLTRDQLTPEQR